MQGVNGYSGNGAALQFRCWNTVSKKAQRNGKVIAATSALG
jgi:hypothetical protein